LTPFGFRVRDGRVKSASEANLLGSDVYYDQQETRSSRKPQGRKLLALGNHKVGNPEIGETAR